MNRYLLLAAACGFGLLVAAAARKGSQKKSVIDRVAAARERKLPELQRLCGDAGISYPPGRLLLRAFKKTAELELWAGDRGDDPMKLLKIFRVVAQSGDPGPKRREGDRQVPEGVYQIKIFNPQSSYHLSLGIDYPNAADRVHADPEQPGGDIYIHGSNVSIGCLALGDDAIEELYVIADDARKNGAAEIPVHIFPARMAGEKWAAMRDDYPQWREFWGELQPIHDAFSNDSRPPEVTVTSAGRYEIASPIQADETEPLRREDILRLNGRD